MHIRAGTSGWQYKEWKGTFYPEDMPTDGMLRYYAERFPAVEVNNTFYRMPKPSVLEGWAEAVPEDFAFVLKASQRITHFGRIGDRATEPLGYLLTTASTLGDRLGPILFQLPPNMKKDAPRLQAFLAHLPAGTRAAFEFRHPSWHDDDEVLSLLRGHDVALCVVSGGEGETAGDGERRAGDGDGERRAGDGDGERRAGAGAGAGDGDGERRAGAGAGALQATASYGYLRLRKEAYGDGELEAWADRILAQPWTEAFVFFKHEDEGTGPKLARRFLDLCAERGRPPSTQRRSG